MKNTDKVGTGTAVVLLLYLLLAVLAQLAFFGIIIYGFVYLAC